MAKLNYTANVPDWQMYIIEIWRNSDHCPFQQQQVLKCPGTVPVCSMAQHHLLLKSLLCLKTECILASSQR